MTHCLVKGQAGTGTLFTQNPGLAGQFLHACLTPAGQRVLRRAEHHQFIFDPGLHFQVRVVAVALD
ncbi:hypothetical protein D3C77_604960 [compost metagenome]